MKPSYTIIVNKHHTKLCKDKEFSYKIVIKEPGDLKKSDIEDKNIERLIINNFLELQNPRMFSKPKYKNLFLNQQKVFILSELDCLIPYLPKHIKYEVNTGISFIDEFIEDYLSVFL